MESRSICIIKIINPHFYTIYREFEAVVAIDTLDVRDGQLPRRARSLVEDWATAHRQELREAWDQARASMPLPTIDGLD